MTPKLITGVILAVFFGLLLSLTASQTPAAELKLEAQLLWGTDDTKPPAGKNYTPVAADLNKKLKDLPLKWTHYFEVNRKSFAVSVGQTRKEPISEKCEIEVKNLDNTTVEVTLFGKGKEVMKRKQALPKGDILVLGGNAPNATAWLVVLRQAQ